MAESQAIESSSPEAATIAQHVGRFSDRAIQRLVGGNAFLRGRIYARRNAVSDLNAEGMQSGCNVLIKSDEPIAVTAELVGNEIVVTPVAEGIENLQIEYGFDANNDGTPDRYLNAVDATLGPGYGSWANVMAVRLYVLVRATDTEFGYQDTTKQFNLGQAGYTEVAGDGYKRTLLTSLVRPMGPAGQRELP